MASCYRVQHRTAIIIGEVIFSHVDGFGKERNSNIYPRHVF